MPISVEAHDLLKISRMAKEFSPALATAMRRNIRGAANVAAEEVKAAALHIPVKAAGSHSTGIRRGIAAGVGVRVATSGKGRVGVFITGSGKALPQSKRALVRAFEKETFRHPVFGTKAFVEQSGHPYFRKTILRNAELLRASVQKSLDEAVAVIEGIK